MKILYITINVLGDSGANAAEIFPKLAFLSKEINYVNVADLEKNKDFITKKQFSNFLKLRPRRLGLYSILRNALRIAKKCKDKDIDCVHAFYREVNIPLIIFLRLALILFRSNTVLIVDHRSVNLAKGRRAFFKKLNNFFMQIFVHHLAGNPLAVETNHFFIFKPKHIIDLGFDTLPDVEILAPPENQRPSIWFIGSMKPKNRKSEFLIEVFDELTRRFGQQMKFDIRVAGPANQSQEEMLNANPNVTYYGSLPRTSLYQLLMEFPGIGMAFMNEEFHKSAPSLKFSEYAAMHFAVVASDTIGMRTQWKRMKYSNVALAKEDVCEWADKLVEASENWPKNFQTWDTKMDWSYDNIFKNQVLKLYNQTSNKLK